MTPRTQRLSSDPLISEREAQRLEGWIESAVARGATLLCGGKRDAAMLQATLLENVPRDEKICQQEAFGPVAVLSPFADFDAALDEINDTVFGLQAGIFTRDLYKAHRAWDRLQVGGVIIGDVPSWRADAMPYGGVKDSGLGREGVRWGDGRHDRGALACRAREITQAVFAALLLALVSSALLFFARRLFPAKHSRQIVPVEHARCFVVGVLSHQLQQNVQTFFWRLRMQQEVGSQEWVSLRLDQ